MSGEQGDLDFVGGYFAGYDLEAVRFSKHEMTAGKTPDFKIQRHGRLVAYCEVKSPCDPWLDDLLDNAASGEIVGGLRSDPVCNRLERSIKGAIEQLQSVNIRGDALNILSIVNHDSSSNFSDLRMLLQGDPGDGTTDLAFEKNRERLRPKIEKLDAIFWFQKSEGGRCTRYWGAVSDERRERGKELFRVP